MPKLIQTLIGVCRGPYRALRYWLTHVCTLKDLLETVLILLFLLPTVGSMKAGTWASEYYRFPTDRAGVDPPWLILREEYVKGMCHGAGLLLSIAVYWTFRKRFENGGRVGLIFSLLLLTPMACRAVIIWFNCSHIMEPALATTPWPTIRAYRYDDWISLSMWMPIYLLFLVFVCFKINDAIRARKEDMKQKAELANLSTPTIATSP